MHLLLPCAPLRAARSTRSTTAATHDAHPGTVNGSGMLLMRAARVGKDTTLSQVGWGSCQLHGWKPGGQLLQLH